MTAKGRAAKPPAFRHRTANAAAPRHAVAGHAATGHAATGHAATGHAATGHTPPGKAATRQATVDAPSAPAGRRRAARANTMPSALDRLRAICLELPEAAEKQTWEVPTFRVRDKIFAMAHAPGEVWCKAPPGAQAILVGAAPERFFAPPYVGPKGWIGVRLDDDSDWDEVAALIRRSYRMTAPKRLAALVPEER